MLFITVKKYLLIDLLFSTFLVILNNNTIFQLYTLTCSAEFAVLLCVCIYFPDDDLVEAETCRTKLSDKLFIIDHAICWIRYRMTYRLYCV